MRDKNQQNEAAMCPTTHQYYSSIAEHRPIKPKVAGANPALSNPGFTPVQKAKGSSLKTKGSKVQCEQGCKRQVSKDVAQSVIGCERPDISYVSSFEHLELVRLP